MVDFRIIAVQSEAQQISIDVLNNWMVYMLVQNGGV